MKFTDLHRTLFALALLLLVSSCGNDTGPIVPELQPLAAPREPHLIDATSAQRFPKFADRERKYRYLPGSSWARLKPTSFRTLNFAFGPDGAGECYLSEISGFTDGGLANINRWRQQMGSSELTAADLAVLPRKPMAGHEATFVSIDGNFSGMGSSIPKANHRMLAMLYDHEGHSLSVKMTGPRALIEYEESEFLAFCETFQIIEQAPPFQDMRMGPFSFLKPRTWTTVQPESTEIIRRPFGFTFGVDQEASCQLGIITDPEHGGIQKVINQWLSASNRPAMDDAAIAQLPQQGLLGNGSRVDVVDQNGRRFVGIASELGAQGHGAMTILAELTGPPQVIEQNLTLFDNFCESLKIKASTSPSPH